MGANYNGSVPSYNTALWKRIRKRHLAKEPLCCYCAKQGMLTPGNVVDHRIPHRGNPDLFFDEENLQTLCATHAGTKTREESGHLVAGCDIEGNPLSPNHPWFGK